MTQAPRSSDPSDNPFWPYDLDLPPDQRSPRRFLAWSQHARLADFARRSARALTGDAPRSDEGVIDMQATVRTGWDRSSLSSLLTLLEDDEIVLGSFTEEELAVVDPPGEEPLVPLTVLDLTVDSDEVRDKVLATAMRSLLARGLLRLGEEAGDVAATGVLGTVAALRAAPNSLLVVEHVEEDEPERRVVYGLDVPTEAGTRRMFMEETVALLGHHEFVLRSADGQGAALADWLSSGAPTSNGRGFDDLDAALDELHSVTRLYACQRDDDAPGEPEFSEVELTLADGGPCGRWMVLFQPADDGGREGILTVPVERLDLKAFFAGLLRLDLTPFNEALAAS